MTIEPTETLADMLDAASYLTRAKIRRDYMRSIGNDQRADACGRFGVVCPICLREQYHGYGEIPEDAAQPYCEHQTNDYHDVLVGLGLEMFTPAEGAVSPV